MNKEPKMLTLRVWSLFVWSVPLILLLLKYFELQSEKRLAGLPQTTPLSELCSRRFDDPSFWAILASALAALLVIRGAQKLGPQPRKWVNAPDFQRFNIWGMIFVALFYLGYLITTGLKGEGLFFLVGGGPKNRDAEVICIQAVEGLLNLAVTWIMMRFFVVALVAIEEIRGKAIGAAADALILLRQSASCLVSAGVLPISAFLFVPVTYEVLTVVFGYKPDFTKPWPIWSGFFVILPMAIPFGIVAVRGMVRLKATMRPSLNILAMLHVVIWCAMITMGYAGCKPPEKIVSTNNPLGVIIGVAGVFILASSLIFWIEF